MDNHNHHEHAAPIGRMYPAVLGAILVCLDSGALHCALAVSRSWSAFIRSSMPCAGFIVPCTAKSLVRMSSSALARHVAGIQHTEHARCKLTSDSLYILAFAMPQLISLQCELIPSPACKMILPAKLKTLELDLSAIDADGINRTVEAIGQLSALAHLTLELPSWSPAVSFGPLSKCAALDRLIVKQPPMIAWSAQPTDAHIEQLRTLQHLRNVNVEDLNGASLTKLLRVPHSLQWTELGGLNDVDGVGAAALRNLPGLLTLDMWNCRDVSFLPALSLLQSLALEIQDEPWAVTADALVESLSSCSQLTDLTLLAPVTSNHLTLLLPHLTLLQSLTLVCGTELESLSFLSSVPSLRELNLRGCCHPDLRSSELCHIHTLKDLIKLALWKAFAEPLDQATQQQLTPPTVVLPNLKSFLYAPPSPPV